MFAPTDSCGWHLVFCFIWHTAASTVGSTLFLCKEVSLVWQPWRRLWWNVLRRSSLGLPIRLPKGLSMCGATSWWYVAYEGRPVPNAEGEQELEQRAAVFRTSASFWENGVHEWETNDVRSRNTYTEAVKEPQWQASGFMVCTRHEI